MHPTPTLELLPRIGVGPIRFGMRREQVEDTLDALGLESSGSHEALMYFCENALQVEFTDQTASFIGLARSARYQVRLYGLDPFAHNAKTVFDAVLALEGGEHRFDANEQLFPNSIITLWGTDDPEDTDATYAQVGVGDERHLALVRSLEGGT